MDVDCGWNRHTHTHTTPETKCESARSGAKCLVKYAIYNRDTVQLKRKVCQSNS